MREEIERAAREYLALQEKEKEIKAHMAACRKLLMEHIAKTKLPFITDDVQFAVKERISYAYDPEKLKELVGEETARFVITEAVDVKKLKGLIKGGLIGAQTADQARQEVKRVKALVIEKMKGDGK